MALAILDSFDQDFPRQSLAEICRRTDAPKASALRHLAALERAGYVARHPEGRYSLGPRVLEPARAYLRHNRLVASARPVLDDLAAETGETAHLGVLQGSHIIYVAIAESPQRVRAYVQQGDRIPAHAVASGKAILAFAPAVEVERVIANGLERLSEHTLVRPEELRDDLATSRARGYALNRGEWIEEVWAASAPVLDHAGTVVAAMGVAGPRLRLNADNIHAIGASVCRHAARLSRGLGASDRSALP